MDHTLAVAFLIGLCVSGVVAVFALASRVAGLEEELRALRERLFPTDRTDEPTDDRDQ